MTQASCRLSITGALRPLPKHDPHGEARPFPLQPAFDLATRDCDDVVRKGERAEGTILAAAERFGVDRQLIYRWLDQGVGVYVADGIAIRLGLHPWFIWPDWFDRAPEEAEKAEREAVTATRVAELRDGGMSYPKIAMALAGEGNCNPRSGAPWHKDTLRIIYQRVVS